MPIAIASWIAYPALINVSKQTLTEAVEISVDTEEIRLPIKGYCSIAHANNTCILHGCQSTSGSSGAPMLAWDKDGRFSVVGIHIATAANYDQILSEDDDCDIDKAQLKTGKYIGNLAIPIPQSIRDISKQ